MVGKKNVRKTERFFDNNDNPHRRRGMKRKEKHSMDLDRIKRVGIAAAYKGAEVLRSKFGNISQARKKGVIDLVTEADTFSEECILQVIRTAFPEHSILAEESGQDARDASLVWIVDPLDGTTNFAHQIGWYAISIAFAVDGEVLVGIVLNPVTGELFSATVDDGATCNNHSIRVSSVSNFSDCLLVTGFPYNIRENLEPIVTRFTRCLSAAQGIRRLGSAALDLCYVACGRFEGFWEEYLQPWDTAAGVLIAREAGAHVSDFSGRPHTLAGRETLATNGRIHEEMLKLLQLP